MPRVSLDQLRQQIARLEGQAKKLEASEGARKKKAVAEVRALMRKLGVEQEDLLTTVPGKPKRVALEKNGAKKPRPAVPVKFRNAESGETWTGRGRTPRWLAALEATGRAREEFKVD